MWEDPVLPDAIEDHVVPPAVEDQVVPDAIEDHVVPQAVEDHVVPPPGEDQAVPVANEDHVVPRAVEDHVVPPAGEDQAVPVANEGLDGDHNRMQEPETTRASEVPSNVIESFFAAPEDRKPVGMNMWAWSLPSPKIRERNLLVSERVHKDAF